MNFQKTINDDVDVNLTPLIDVVFLLLIFFMVTTTFARDAKINIKLPTTQNAVATTTQNKGLEVIVDNKGNFFVDGHEVINSKPETLFRAMSQALDKLGEDKPPLTISVDAGTSYQKVVTAMDIAGRLGLTNFSLSTSNIQKK